MSAHPPPRPPGPGLNRLGSRLRVRRLAERPQAPRAWRRGHGLLSRAPSTASARPQPRRPLGTLQRNHTECLTGGTRQLTQARSPEDCRPPTRVISDTW